MLVVLVVLVHEQLAWLVGGGGGEWSGHGSVGCVHGVGGVHWEVPGRKGWGQVEGRAGGEIKVCPDLLVTG